MINVKLTDSKSALVAGRVFYCFYFGKSYCKLRQIYSFKYVSFVWITRIGTEIFFILTIATAVLHTSYRTGKGKMGPLCHNRTTDFSVPRPPLAFIAIML